MGAANKFNNTTFPNNVTLRSCVNLILVAVFLLKWWGGGGGPQKPPKIGSRKPNNYKG